MCRIFVLDFQPHCHVVAGPDAGRGPDGLLDGEQVGAAFAVREDRRLPRVAGDFGGDSD